MSDSKGGAPQVKVEVAVDDVKATAQQKASRLPKGDPKAQGKAARDAVTHAKDVAYGWFDGAAPGHGNAIFFGIMGFLAAVLIFVVGFWETLLMVVFVLVGVTFGQWLDGDPKIWNALRSLIRPRD